MSLGNAPCEGVTLSSVPGHMGVAVPDSVEDGGTHPFTLREPEVLTFRSPGVSYEMDVPSPSPRSSFVGSET